MKPLSSHLLILFLFFSLYGSAQNFRYEFKIDGIDTIESAKYEMDHIRDILGVQSIFFDDLVDKFVITTHLDFDVGESVIKLQGNGVAVIGSITKINIG